MTCTAEPRWRQATESAFSEILSASQSDYVLFWVDDAKSDSCGVMAARFYEFAEDFEDQLTFVRIDFRRTPRLAAALGTRSAPAVALVKDTRVLRSAHGELVPEMLNTIGSTFFADDIAICASVSPEQLRTMLGKRQAIVMDVRDEKSFQRTHIPGAVSTSNIDSEGFVAHLARRRRTRPIIFYDRYDGAAAHDILKIARAHGLRCGILAGGLLAWEGSGFPVERS